MFRFFKSWCNKAKPEESIHSYIGVAAAEYGANYDLTPLILKKLDEDIKDDIYFNLAIGNKRFTDFEQAMKYTSRRGVSDHSAYVIGLKCSIDQIDIHRKKGELRDLIVSITNAVTKESITKASDLLDKTDTDRPHSSSIKF
jgi:hypothetical protein